MKKIFLFLLTAPLMAQAANIQQEPSLNPEKKVISVSGEIAAGDADVLKGLVSTMAQGELVIKLNSPGGSVSEGERIVENIQLLKARGIKINTSVRNGEQCGSMCLPIFLTGDERNAAEVAAFYFHGVMPSAFCLVLEEKLTQKYIALLMSLGMSPRFKEYLDKEEVFTSTSKFWLSGRELAAVGHGFITKLATRHPKNSGECLNKWGDRPR